MKKKLVAIILMTAMSVMTTACGNSNSSKNQGTEAQKQPDETIESNIKISMVSDTAGVNDKSFNQSAWEGLQLVEKNTGATVSYLESTQESDYATNLDKLVDDDNGLVWGIGFAMAGAVQYADSFGDSAKGKAIATAMYSNGSDVIFHAAAGVGIGVIEAAVEADKWVIGVDSDQSYLAPKNVLTSSLKRVDVAVQNLSERFAKGENIGGQTFTFGLADGGVGIPENNPNMDDEVYKKTMEVQEKIAAGQIVPPYNADTLEEFNQ